VAERINAYRTLAIGLALWSIATAASGLATGFVTLLALRVLLGLGESATFPCFAKLLAEHLPPARFGTANGSIGVGMALGPALGTFIGGLLMANIGWRAVFVAFGIVSFLWLLPWYRLMRSASTQPHRAAAGSVPALKSIIRRRELWGASFGYFTGNYAFYFVLSWLPLYLVQARGGAAVDCEDPVAPGARGTLAWLPVNAWGPSAQAHWRPDFPTLTTPPLSLDATRGRLRDPQGGQSWTGWVV
jgi:MFS family permease